jgi:hypothetical protein
LLLDSKALCALVVSNTTFNESAFSLYELAGFCFFGPAAASPSLAPSAGAGSF